MNKPRLLLAEDHTLVLEGFRRLVEGEFDVIGTVQDGRSLVQEAERLRPDVILLEISLPLLNGIEAARQLNKSIPGSKIIFVTVHAGADYVHEALRAGGSGYLLKRSAASELSTAIHEVLRGRQYITPLLTSRTEYSASDGEGAVPQLRPNLFRRLTPRQREVLQLIAEGLSAKEIAALLQISVKTIEFHKAGMARSLGVRTTAELIRYAVEDGIVGR